jgi:predicted Zn-dependent protease
VGYAHASELSEAAIKRAAETVKAVTRGHGGVMAEAPAGTNRMLYTDDNPLGLVAFATKVDLLAEIDAYARAKDPRVKQVAASLSGQWQAVQILRAGGEHSADVRPLVRLNVQVVVGEGERMESGSHGAGGRISYDTPSSGGPASTRPCARRWSTWSRCRRRPAKCRWCWGRAGRACCCTRRWATAWKATSTARRPRPFRA